MNDNSKPILFNRQMVMSIQRGQKTCTRRTVKTKGEYGGWKVVGLPPHTNGILNERGYVPIIVTKHADDGNAMTVCEIKPDYQVGDILYIRENWMPLGYRNDGLYYIRYADGQEIGYHVIRPVAPSREGKWHPSIHMPRAFARLYLRVTNVHMERLQDMPISDIRCEGLGVCERCKEHGCAAKSTGTCPYADENIAAFKTLWDGTVKQTVLDKYGWDVNPLVWVYRFVRVRMPTIEEKR